MVGTDTIYSRDPHDQAIEALERAKGIEARQIKQGRRYYTDSSNPIKTRILLTTKKAKKMGMI